MFIDECVAYYRTDQTFFIPDRVTEEIPLNRIAYFFQVINQIFCIFHKGVLFCWSFTQQNHRSPQIFVDRTGLTFDQSGTLPVLLRHPVQKRPRKSRLDDRLCRNVQKTRLPPDAITPEKVITALSHCAGAVWGDRHCPLLQSVYPFLFCAIIKGILQSSLFGD